MAPAKSKGLFKEFRPGISTGSKWSLDLALQWVEICIKTHKLCQSKTPSEGYSYLPTRLIHTGQYSSRSVHLCQTKHLKGNIRYITLNHRWGQAHEHIEKCNLKCENEATMLLGINVKELPRTFQDAILLAREFGIGYLWIDSLCIIQDSESDWRHESKKKWQRFIRTHFVT